MHGSSGQLVSDDDELLFSEGLPFIVTAAHELKSPLSLLRQLALGLENQSLTELDRARMTRQMVLTTERGLRLTTDLSRAARLEDSLFELEPLNPQQLCEEVAHELSPLYNAKNREIRVYPRKKQILVVANRELLRRIMLGFGDNALNYAEVDSPVELQIRGMNDGQRVRIGVRDHGPAVASDIWQRLQRHIGRSAQVMHSRPQSSGLGLYVAGQFARAMNARIGAIRHHDGATFYVEVDASTQLRLL